ncbi:uncharacterized protein si:ch1073-220m6.1 [Thunnus maccoyii]|uniref:uncharacterized protein si:ch1073-220m6.1 n=1 Tax=Thunnus maccoyii TaxID=8240 RepID=UPI001C4C6349|nr:uncharacterized protein si:ch1073-220m6.1 [Thunnus maccoyii]XP_042257149.1 uncharacterized protein si:ch1073-220m6.1 [Thunnus maccoyii]
MFLLLSFIIAGTMAEDPSMIHYRLKNSSICLHVKKPPPYQSGQWTFAEKAIIYGNSINPDYAEKVDYEPKNLTLCVRDLNETNSGIYQVSFVDSKFNAITESHKVIVQDAVPRPVIRMSVLHSNLSARLCTIRVNCSIQEDWVWSVCDENGCKTPQESLSRVNISISIDNRTVVCSGNNHVSTNNVSESVEATCFNKSNPEQKQESQPTVPVIILIIIIVVVILSFTVFMAKKCWSTENNHHQTHISNAQLMQSQPVEMQPQESLPRPRVSTSSSQGDVTYENVETTCASQTSNPTISPGEELGSKQSQEVDTVYSLLQAPAVTASLGKSDNGKNMKACKKIREATFVTLDEADHTRQIDTVYSVLQKPKSLKAQHHQQDKQDVEKPKT